MAPMKSNRLRMAVSMSTGATDHNRDAERSFGTDGVDDIT
jgi:hypothetical protein